MKKKIIRIILLVTSLFCLLFAFSVHASAAETIGVPGGKFFRIKNVASGKYLNVHLGVDANGTNVYQWTKDGSDEQRFKLNYDDDKSAYKIAAYCSSSGENRVLDVIKTDGTVVNGSNVQIYTLSDSRAQRWKIVPISAGKYRIYPRLNSAVSLAAYGSSNGTSGGTTSTSAGNVYLKTYSASDTSQQWYIEPDYYYRHIADGDYYIRNRNSGLYLDVVNNGTSSATLTCQYDFRGRRNQIWTFKYQNGVYRISPKNAPNLSLDVSGASAENGAKLQVYTSAGTIAQQFRLADSTGTSLRIMPRTGNDNKDVVVQSASIENGANIIQYTHNGTANEDWYIEPYHAYTNSNHTNSSYDRTKARHYASQYADTPNSNYLFLDGRDCTNFVSQSLLHGGMYEWDDGDRTSNGSWYYGSILGVYYSSYTWGAAHNFSMHWGKFNGSGIQRASKTTEYPNAAAMLGDWDRIFPELLNGDIIQFERDGENNVVGHSVIIHESYDYNLDYNVPDVLYAQHSGSNGNTKDQSLYSLLKKHVKDNKDQRIIIHKIK